jgi:hypothetical protein
MPLEFQDFFHLMNQQIIKKQFKTIQFNQIQAIFSKQLKNKED